MNSLGDEKFISEFSMGYRAYKNNRELPESATDNFARGWMTRRSQEAYTYEEEQRATARSIANGN